ncbi:MAG: hypothetical protein ACXWF0_13380 [Usitatibacter sp.]
MDTGVAVPDAPNATCTFPAGTLPWATLGMNRDDAYDPWSWKISYRVYTGNGGSLTQAGGTSEVNCTTIPGASGAVSARVGNSGGLCNITLDTPPANYLAGKGLSVNDFGVAHTDAAYVLISHGISGLGAYTSAGLQKALPSSANELSNTQATGPFFASAATRDIAPEDIAHFDDLVSFVALSDLITRAQVGARAWAATVAVGYTMNSATVSAALGHAVSAGDVGTNRIDFGSGSNRARVRGFQSGLSTDIAYDTTGGATSLGVAGAGINFLSNVNSDTLRIDFSQDVFKLGIALADFGTYSVLGTTFTEQVQFRFSRGTGPGATTVTIVKSACRVDGGVATFSIDPGTDFERVEVTPLSASPPGPSQFGVADFQACGPGAGACLSALASLATACP